MNGKHMITPAVYPIVVDDGRTSGALVFFRIVVESSFVSTVNLLIISSTTSVSSVCERLTLVNEVQKTSARDVSLKNDDVTSGELTGDGVK